MNDSLTIATILVMFLIALLSPLIAFRRCWKPSFDPDLIDLHEYEARLLLQRDANGALQPPHSILARTDRAWTCEEMEAMRQNRRLAEEIFKRVQEKR